MNDKVCLITGVGPGTGSALARRFAEGYRVAMIARNAPRLAELSRELSGARGYACDVSDAAQLTETVEKIRTELGAPDVVIDDQNSRHFVSHSDDNTQEIDDGFRRLFGHYFGLRSMRRKQKLDTLYAPCEYNQYTRTEHIVSLR